MGNSDIVKGLKPERIFKYFADICDIPHGSNNTNKIAEYLVAFAKSNKFIYIRDAYDNVVIKKQSSNPIKKPIILQSHIDMVCVKEKNCDKDMLKEGIDLVVEDRYLKAVDTSLGADDGIGVAITMAILTEEYEYNRDIIAIFTSDEEIGLIGASKIDLNSINAEYLINIDNEEFGTIVGGCAGSIHLQLGKKIEFCDYKKKYLFTVNICGCLGGHSAKAIMLNRVNAIIEMFKLLSLIKDKFELQLIKINGGEFSNTIAPDCNAVFTINKEVKISDVEKLIMDFRECLKDKYTNSDPGIKIDYEYVFSDLCQAISYENTMDIIDYINSMPYGVIEMNELYSKIPKTSINLGIVKTIDKYVQVDYQLRSNIDCKNQELLNKCFQNVIKYNFKILDQNSYPAWEYKYTDLEEKSVMVFKHMFNYAPTIKVSHGGLEPGILLKKLNGTKAIAIGPTAIGIHSTDEKLDIESTNKIYCYIKKLIAELD